MMLKKEIDMFVENLYCWYFVHNTFWRGMAPAEIWVF
jgi:hypothetical protein